MNKTTIKQKMKEIFIKSKCDLTDDELDKFCHFYELFDKYNDEYDLSRIKTFDDTIIKHFVDSIYVAKLHKLPESVVDIGTGAGFPGIPLKILLPDTHIILAEPRHKRVKFMNMVIKELDLKNVEVYPHKVTDESLLKVKGVITRAFESINNTFERTINFLPKDGQIIFMKGPGVDEDFINISEHNKDYFELINDIPYALPHTTHKRRLVIYRKITDNFTRTYKFMSVDKTSSGLPISSTDNKKYKEYKKLTTSQGIKKSGLTTISGQKQIIEVYNKYPAQCKSLILKDGYTDSNIKFNRLIESFEENNSLFILKKSLFKDLDALNSNAPLMICQIPEIKEWDKSCPKKVAILIPFQDPANVGTAIRSALAFGVKDIIILAESANPFHPKSIRTSGGTVFSANLFKGPSIKEISQICYNSKIPIISLDKSGEDINSFEFPENFLLLPGIEGPGLPASLKDNAVSIPINDTVESLNAAIATSIVLFKWNSSINK